ncbi:cell division protein ZapA [Metapseudomonas lalkuanensis]|uniref:Cell division protein ZapA n=1 Tax=Metapseudomonas lalkuanensis TaxID=2604832 RepID=A0A5J6QLU8_9GAMM|nr:cell division protein ZapA [Pseudomonas lalkuanensis]QEY62632.1 cell division protein ZapA [Pseudomonas lalkuanensis]UCO96144.1 cell division protein ZapA [Pseudomonas lalkuanensis]
MSTDSVRVLRILGREYNIKAPAGEEQVLQDAAAMLQAEIAANKKKFPYVTANELVVLSALNLCARQLNATDKPKDTDDVTRRLAVLNRRIRAQLDDTGT